jgi:hypothetical protein
MLVDEPLENGGDFYLMRIFELFFLVGQDDSVVNDSDVHLELSLVNGFQSDFLFLGRETDLKDIPPDLSAMDLTDPLCHFRIVVGNLLVALFFAILNLVVLVKVKYFLL